MAEILESAMLVAFGAAWPAALVHSLRSRTARGTSLSFLLIVLTGYACGISAKLISGRLNYVFLFYVLDAAMVLCGVLIYFRNRRLDKKKGARTPSRRKRD
ncbi:MAG: hypothetical protein LBP61_06085 [Desulfovibrio sp.]|jgi:uncharacterized membrane protein (DUF485 family)|nr:hypothetical protein [Desulfovibrio sp.]